MTEPQVSGLRSQVSRVKISCLILTYNESDRLRLALTHALKWADEVVVVDKTSTDTTREIAREMGARVATIPFSRQGHESVEMFAAQAKHDWVWAFTPGEVPTPALIDSGRMILEERGADLDLVMVPMRYYSFGIHSEKSPWSGGYQPRLYNRWRVQFTGTAHDPIRADRATRIEPGPDCYVLHQTHISADAFIRAHADYAINEANNGTPEEAYTRARHAMEQWAPALASDTRLVPHALAWRIYHLNVMLHAWQRAQLDTPVSPIPEQYRARAQSLIDTYWLS